MVVAGRASVAKNAELRGDSRPRQCWAEGYTGAQPLTLAAVATNGHVRETMAPGCLQELSVGLISFGEDTRRHRRLALSPLRGPGRVLSIGLIPSTHVPGVKR